MNLLDLGETLDNKAKEKVGFVLGSEKTASAVNFKVNVLIIINILVTSFHCTFFLA